MEGGDLPISLGEAVEEYGHVRAKRLAAEKREKELKAIIKAQLREQGITSAAGKNYIASFGDQICTWAKPAAGKEEEARQWLEANGYDGLIEDKTVFNLKAQVKEWVNDKKPFPLDLFEYGMDNNLSLRKAAKKTIVESNHE